MSGNRLITTERIVNLEKRVDVIENWGKGWMVDLIHALLVKWEEDLKQMKERNKAEFNCHTGDLIAAQLETKQADIDELRGILGKAGD